MSSYTSANDLPNALTLCAVNYYTQPAPLKRSCTFFEDDTDPEAMQKPQPKKQKTADLLDTDQLYASQTHILTPHKTIIPKKPGFVDYPSKSTMKPWLDYLSNPYGLADLNGHSLATERHAEQIRKQEPKSEAQFDAVSNALSQLTSMPRPSAPTHHIPPTMDGAFLMTSNHRPSSGRRHIRLSAEDPHHNDARREETARLLELARALPPRYRQRCTCRGKRGGVRKWQTAKAALDYIRDLEAQLARYGSTGLVSDRPAGDDEDDEKLRVDGVGAVMIGNRIISSRILEKEDKAWERAGWKA